jgi:hypothetical protein
LENINERSAALREKKDERGFFFSSLNRSGRKLPIVATAPASPFLPPFCWNSSNYWKREGGEAYFEDLQLTPLFKKLDSNVAYIEDVMAGISPKNSFHRTLLLIFI